MEAVQDYKFSFLSDVHFVVRFSILGGIIEQKTIIRYLYTMVNKKFVHLVHSN